MRNSVLIVSGLGAATVILAAAVSMLTQRRAADSSSVPAPTSTVVDSLNAPSPPIPSAPPTLSYFEPHAGGCAWYKRALPTLFPGHEDAEVNELISVFPCDCNNVQWSWSLEQGGVAPRSAIVWFDTETYGSDDELLFDVDLVTRKHKRLPVPERGDGVAYVREASGALMALTIDYAIEIGADAAGEPRVMAEDGTSYVPHPFAEGTDVLVHAMRLKDGAWETVETKASRCCEGGGPGIQALATYARLFEDKLLEPLQSRLLLAATDDLPGVPDGPLRHTLDARLPKELALAGVRWLSMRRPDWGVGAVFRAGGDERRHASGLALLVDEAGGLRPLPAFPFARTDVLRLSPRGPLLLSAEAETGMRPFVYDMTTGSLRFSVRLGHGASFWP